MKAPQIALTLAIAVAAAAGGWFAARHRAPAAEPAAAATSSSSRRVLYYQSSMHPWIKSDKPGRCTICGMELSPVFEGDKGIDAVEGIVSLGSNAIQVINVQSEEVTRRPLRRSLRFAGTIDDNDSKHRIVSAYIDGRIDTLAVNFIGAEVVAGEPLATFYSPLLLAAEREYVALARQPSPTPASPLTGEHHRLIESAGVRLQRLGLTDAQIAALPEKNANDLHTPLLAPVTGTVVARFAYAGQYVKEGEKLFEIADFSTMWFLFDAYERDLAWLTPGQPVEVTTPAVPGRTFKGTIAFIDPNLKELTRSAKVRVELPNPLVETNGTRRRELFHKLYADASVLAATPEVISIARDAVLSPGAFPVVYVDRGGGAYEQRKIRLGRVGDDSYEVLDGLAAGERVVTRGNLLIDAQAQLNAGSGPASPEHQHGASPAPAANGPTTTWPALTEPQQTSANEFLSVANAITAALAADNLTEFNAQAARTHRVVAALTAAFPSDNVWRPLVTRIEETGHLASSADLKAARKAFHPLSQAAVELVKALRKQNAAGTEARIFRCPMTKDAFAGAPRTAEWIQFGLPVRNPYFGAEMLDCGSEVKP